MPYVKTWLLLCLYSSLPGTTDHFLCPSCYFRVLVVNSSWCCHTDNKVAVWRVCEVNKYNTELFLCGSFNII